MLARHAYGLPLERFLIFWAYICIFSKNSILAYSTFYLLIYNTVKKTWNQEANLEIVEHTRNIIEYQDKIVYITYVTGCKTLKITATVNLNIVNST